MWFPLCETKEETIRRKLPQFLRAVQPTLWSVARVLIFGLLGISTEEALRERKAAQRCNVGRTNASFIRINEAVRTQPSMANR